MDGFAPVPVTCGFDEEPLTIQNSGACPLTITGVTSTSPHFSLAAVMSFPVVIAPGDSLTINVHFVPLAIGPLAGNIVIASDDRANPLKTVPGTKMGYAGVKDPQERADLIAYLKQATAASTTCK